MSELVYFVVVLVGGVGFDPGPTDVQPGAKEIDLGPEIEVCLAFPAEVEALHQEIGIAVEDDFM